MSVIDDIKLAIKRGSPNQDASGIVVSVQPGFITVRIDGSKTPIKVACSNDQPVKIGSRVNLRRDARTSNYTIISANYSHVVGNESGVAFDYDLGYPNPVIRVERINLGRQWIVWGIQIENELVVDGGLVIL